jgi:hypothetical protein
MVIDEVILEPKDPMVATIVAVGPGLLIHGWGQFYSENYNFGLSLLGLELLSVGAMTIGVVENTSPDMITIYGGDTQLARRAGAVCFGIGLVFFAATYFADVFTAGRTADQYNKEHNLEFKVQQESLLNGNIDSVYAAVYNIKF